MTSIERFTDLRTWQEGHKLVIEVYRVTKGFPNNEQFGLTNQLRRAAVSITSNIAEGFSRRTRADKKHSYIMAQGSTTEVQNQLLIARDIGYISQKKFQSLAETTVLLHKLTTGLIRVLKEDR